MTKTTTEFAERRRWLQGALQKSELDGALISSPVNVRYLTGFTGSNALLLVSGKGTEIYTDPRYTVQVEQEADAEQKTIVSGPLSTVACKSIRRRRMRTIGFESRKLDYDSYTRLAGALGERIALKPLGRELELRRAVKSPSEVGAIRRSVNINSQAFEQALRRFKTGMLESELAAELDFQMRRLGAERPSFDTIVASGAHAALPHAQPREVAIQPNAVLLIDMGAQAKGYASDMTRMVLPGKPNRRTMKLYEAVLEAQLEALEAIRPGATAASVDQTARRVLKTAGLDSLFIHSTGHGVGLEIHEYPLIGKTDKSELVAGMVIAVEPGVYVEGWGGIRIEDSVLVTETGYEVLTPTSKELRVL